MSIKEFKVSKSGTLPGERADDTMSDMDGYWWAQRDPKSAAVLAVAAGTALRDDSARRRNLNLLHARMYGNADIAGFGGSQYANGMTGTSPNQIPSRVAFNVVASCVETLASRIGKSKPRPSFLTSGGDWTMQQKAKNLTKFMDALFNETKVHNVAKPVRLDAYVFGTGAMHCFIGSDGRLQAERAFIDELFVDDADGIYGVPRQLIRRKLVSRRAVHNNYGDTDEKRAAIMAVQCKAEDKPLRGRSDMIEVWEAWVLPCGDEQGRHVMAVDGCSLVDERWTLNCFPFIFRKYRPRVLGFWGQGIAEILTGIQVEINRLTRSISEQIRRKGKGRTYYPLNSINPEHLDNSVAACIPYKGGVPPTTDNRPAVSADEFQQLDRYYSRAFQEIGLSELSAAGKKPSGLDAAVALREFNDIETERFALDAQADEQFFMDFAELALDLIRESGGKGYKIRLPNKRFLIALDWKDIGLEKDDYIMQMLPVSSLPSTPGARLQRIQELLDMGIIDMPTAKRLLDFPDIDAEMSLQNAAADDIDACVSQILDDRTPTMPFIEPYQNLDMLIERATVSYLFAKHHGCDEERLDMLRQYINDATEKKLEAMAPPQVLGGAVAELTTGGPPPPIGELAAEIAPTVQPAIPGLPNAQ